MTSKCNTLDLGENTSRRLYRLFAESIHDSLVNAGPKEDPNGWVSSRKVNAFLNRSISLIVGCACENELGNDDVSKYE